MLQSKSKIHFSPLLIYQNKLYEKANYSTRVCEVPIINIAITLIQIKDN
jgi:hypothetical protein